MLGHREEEESSRLSFIPNVSLSLFFSRLFFKTSGDTEEFEVESIRPLREFYIIKLKGVDTLDRAEDFRGRLIWVREKDLQPLDEGRYYFFQLEGCAVVTEDGCFIGVVEDILFIRENDLLVIEKEDRKILVPFTDSICASIDLKKKEIVIDPPDGLLDLNDI